MKLSELKTDENKSILVYGDSGSGKTVFATSFPTPIYVADFDRKVSSAASYFKTSDPERLKQIDYDQFESKGPLGFNTFYNKLAELEKDHEYKTIVLDSITTLADSMMAEVIKQNASAKRMKVNGTQIPAQGDYLIAMSHFKDIIGRFISLKGTKIITAHIAVNKDETTGEILRQPLIWGKLASWLPMVFEEVYRTHTKVENGKTLYLAQTQASRQFVARTQITGLPNPMELSYRELEKFL